MGDCCCTKQGSLRKCFEDVERQAVEEQFRINCLVLLVFICFFFGIRIGKGRRKLGMTFEMWSK